MIRETGEARNCTRPLSTKGVVGPSGGPEFRALQVSAAARGGEQKIGFPQTKGNERGTDDQVLQRD